jgi:hypothetical protein
MKLKEVCRAFGEEKKLTNKEGYVYEIDEIGNNIKVIKPLAKTRGVSITPFVDPESMLIYEEYNLTFFEAMRKADDGWIVSNDDWSEIEYVMHDGIPYYSGNGEIASFRRSELQAKWKAVRKVE